MQVNFDKKPETILPVGNGKYYYRYGIAQLEAEEGESWTAQEVTVKEVTASAIKEAVIAELWPPAEENKLVNDYNAAKAGLLGSEHTTAYMEYLNKRNRVKAQVDRDMQEYNGLPVDEPEDESIGEARAAKAIAVESQKDTLLSLMLTTATLTDEQALSVKYLYPEWKAGEAYESGRRVLHEGRLYTVRQKVTAQAHQAPGTTGMASIYAEVNESNGGTKTDPIPYSSTAGMLLEVGKYYTEDGITYLCTRELQAVHPLSALVGHYVEVAN